MAIKVINYNRESLHIIDYALHISTYLEVYTKIAFSIHFNYTFKIKDAQFYQLLFLMQI